MAPPAVLRVAVLGLVSLAVAMGIGRFAFTPLLPMMQQDGLIGIVDGGVLASVHFLGYWLGAVSAARLPLAPRTAFLAALTAIGLSTVAMGLTDAFAVWLALRFVAGVCSAWVLVLVSTYAMKALAEGGGAARQGWVFAGVGVGIAIAGLACLGFMAFGVGSAAAWLIIGAVTLAATAAVAVNLGPELPTVRPVPAARHGDGRAPLDWRAVIAYGTMGVGYIIPATYLPVMARAAIDDPLVFGWSWPVFGAAAFLSTIASERLHARFSNRQIWAAGQAVMAVGVLLPAVAPHFAAVVVAGLAVGGTFVIVTMAGIKEAHRIAPPADVTRHIAVLTAAFATGQMIGPLGASLAYDLTGDFAVSLAVTSGLLLATAAPLIIATPRTAVAKPR